MAQIASTNTKPELIVRKFLYENGFRFRIHYKDLPGKPDIVFIKQKTAIFVNGCFWHGHKNCSRFTLPKTNTEYWRRKIVATARRDRESLNALNGLNYNVITI